ncbi:MAG: methyltransferase [Candidatus Methanomethylicia archaeon]
MYRENSFYGFKVDIFRGVYYPSDDSYLLADFIKKMEENYDYGLDVGCGCGLLSLLLAKICKYVVAIDINHSAVKNTLHNIKENHLLHKISTIHGDLVTSIKIKPLFDIVVFNPPYLPYDEDENILPIEERWAWSGGLDGRLIIDRFIEIIPYILKYQGAILIIQSSLSNPQKTINKLVKIGFNVNIVSEKSFFFEKIYLLEVKKK